MSRMIPRERGGWWHAYVCPAHGLELDHGDVLSGVFPEGGARCARGCRVDTPEVRGAWTVLAHQAWARRIRVLALRGEDADAVRLLVEYADVYRELAADGHEGAQAWMLRGRLFHQALTDAIWAVNIGHAVWTLAEHGAPGTDAVLPLLDELERAALDARHVLVDRGDLASNYTTWLTAAGIATGRAAALVRGTSWDGAKQWLDGPHGLYAQLRACVGGDGWEWEGSTYYHGFVLRAALLALRGLAPADVPADVAQRLCGMVDVLAALATDGGVLPALNDGPYVRAPLALEWLELVALAEGFAPSSRLAAVAAQARVEAGAMDDGMDLLLSGQGPWFAGPPLPERPAPAPVTVFEDAGYAVVRSAGVQAVLAFGPHGGSHGHRDKLALSLYGSGACWQPDPGQVPYAHAEFRDHYASTAAHPAFRVDGAEQAECAGRLVARDAVSVTAEVSEAYDGVRAVRRIEAAGSHLVDVLTVEAGAGRQVTAQLRPGVALDVQVQPDGPVRTTWYGPGDEVLHGWHASDGAVRPVTRPGPGTADDPQLTHTWVDLTGYGARIVYASVYRTAAQGPAVTDVRVTGDEVVVERADGSRSVHGTGA
ncbi:heparinase II/III family protein [Streptomyces sp. VRA16 Mangrove soil]|uniref:heparinase II/III domain-containing protein n=1 Tax=Streptomyces sp. VRA16 Mangrove soil TaxID=2817434 RepID=UPI001A9E6AB8|nr:heparinase II/III family protein [Streptomyces sp. VRA16 Mangrove soil]MBO1332969.1 heparinase II/III family protein [Streptomyces sp. VRA16 Mangrove soil]